MRKKMLFACIGLVAVLLAIVSMIAYENGYESVYADCVDIRGYLSCPSKQGLFTTRFDYVFWISEQISLHAPKPNKVSIYGYLDKVSKKPVLFAVVCKTATNRCQSFYIPYYRYLERTEEFLKNKDEAKTEDIFRAGVGDELQATVE